MSIAAVAEQVVRDTLADSGKTCNRPHHFFHITKMSDPTSTPFAIQDSSITPHEHPLAASVAGEDLHEHGFQRAERCTPVIMYKPRWSWPTFILLDVSSA